MLCVAINVQIPRWIDYALEKSRDCQLRAERRGMEQGDMSVRSTRKGGKRGPAPEFVAKERRERRREVEKDWCLLFF